MRVKIIWLAGAIAGCSGGDGAPQDAAVVPLIDAPENAPVITSFAPTPSIISAGVPTMITWNWTYEVNPTLPIPTCSIDNGVGDVMRGQMTAVTITAVTTFTLTCTNRNGTAMRQAVVGVPAAAPIIATFTATPSTVTSGAATSVTWAWTYSNIPSPSPTCTIEHGVGAVTSGSASSVTQTGSRMYRLRCTNSAGSGVADALVSVDECTAGTHDCQVNADCVDTTDGFTCQCKTGFTGDGDSCGSQQACGTTPALCDTNADCVGASYCRCKPGYVGDGTPNNCTRVRLAFTTSTSGTGDLSTWAGAGGVGGLAAADNVCNTSAAAAGLPGTYVAWMSDATSDAYCRVHGLTGKKANNCGLGALPVGAGPWARTDAARSPFAPAIDRLLAPAHALYYPASFTELGAELATTARVYTATSDAGELVGTACQSWTSASSAATGSHGDVHGGGGGSWTDASATDLTCNTFAHIRCVERDATVPTTSGPALPSRHPIAKKAFVTSVSGTGMLGTWADAGGQTSMLAADQICQARARFAGYANPQGFKAWLSGSSSTTYASTRIVSIAGPWARPDGIMLAASEADLYDGRLTAAINQTEAGSYLAGNADSGSVWTGTGTSGSSTFLYCSSVWASILGSGTVGRHDTLDARWTASTTAACTDSLRLYCLED